MPTSAYIHTSHACGPQAVKTWRCFHCVQRMSAWGALLPVSGAHLSNSKSVQLLPLSSPSRPAEKSSPLPFSQFLCYFNLTIFFFFLIFFLVHCCIFSHLFSPLHMPWFMQKLYPHSIFQVCLHGKFLFWNTTMNLKSRLQNLCTSQHVHFSLYDLPFRFLCFCSEAYFFYIF